MWPGELEPLRAGRLERRRTAHRQHKRVRLGGDRGAVGAGAHQHDRARTRIEIVAIDREARAAAEHHVELLVAAAVGRLVVRLDHRLAGGLGAVGRDADRPDAKQRSQWVPSESGGKINRLDLVDCGYGVAAFANSSPRRARRSRTRPARRRLP